MLDHHNYPLTCKLETLLGSLSMSRVNDTLVKAQCTAAIKLLLLLCYTHPFILYQWVYVICGCM